MLSKEEVLKIAKLSRLELTEEEIEKYTSQLSDVLAYVEKLNELDTDNVDETSQVTGLENVYRSDEVDQCDYQEDLIKQAAENEAGQIKVKAVFD